jgi:putative transposase
VKSHFRRNDVRIRRRIFGKYGKKQRNRVNQILHHVSKAIVDKAKEKKFGIVMENLRGIRKLYRKGNRQGKRFRSRLNSWSFYELQRQIEYKAKWEGIPVEYVRASNTSKTCYKCGSINKALTSERVFQCPNCGVRLDRDLNASVNILKKSLNDSEALTFGADESPNEAMVTECLMTNPKSRWRRD